MAKRYVTKSHRRSKIKISVKQRGMDEKGGLSEK